MKRFKFKYENILKLRLDAEEAVKKELKQANAQLIQLEELLEKTQLAYKAFQLDLELQLSSGLKGSMIQRINQNQMYYRDSIEYAKDDIKRQEETIDRIKANLAEAMKERKIMEKLKEKAIERFNEEMKFQEIKETDEIVNFQNSKRSGD